MADNLNVCLQDYIPPSWAAILKNVPSQRVKLANLDTPIHKWNLPGVPEGFEIFIKRDDMTGSTLSGQKVRKLEFLLADAMAKGCTQVITFGNLQSNQCRATAVAARQLGMKCHAVVRTKTMSPEDITCCSGNIFLTKLVGADLYFAPHIAPYETELKPRMEIIRKHIEVSTREKVYEILSASPDPIGLHGYLGLFQELENQGVLDQFDDIILPCAGGGTSQGIAIGNYLTGSKLRIHAIGFETKHKYINYLYDSCKQTLISIGLDYVNPKDIIRYVEGHDGDNISNEEIFGFIKEISKYTGILLDPVYTGKAAFAFMKELNLRPEQFKGKRILFLHTGGMFNLFDQKFSTTVMTDTTSKMVMWPKLDESPFYVQSMI